MPFDLHAIVRGASKTWKRVRNVRTLRRVDRVGADVTLAGVPHFENLGTIEIGDDVAISSVPVQSHFVTGVGASLRIGSRVTIGSGAAITAHESIEIEDDARLGDGVVIMDTDFHASKDHAVDPVPAPVIIGAAAQLGDRVTVLKGSRIGRGARIASGSVVASDIPDGAAAQGVPARVTRDVGGGNIDRSERRTIAPPAVDTTSEAVRERVAAIVASTFRVARVSLDDGPSAVPGWDSLGSLRLLVAIEDAYGVVLPEALFARAKTVGALADEVAGQLS